MNLTHLILMKFWAGASESAAPTGRVVIGLIGERGLITPSGLIGPGGGLVG